MKMNFQRLISFKYKYSKSFCITSCDWYCVHPKLL